MFIFRGVSSDFSMHSPRYSKLYINCCYLNIGCGLDLIENKEHANSAIVSCLTTYSI
jgi:hypothetical protein